MNSAAIETVDPEIAGMISNEALRQESGLELIASENTASCAVMEAQGSVLTNKYAEGYPAKRYYGGCLHVDKIESLAIERAMQLFGAEYVNVQPHSGSGANMGAYFAMLKPGDTVLAMDLSHGGHLTHGSDVSFSGRLFDFVHYGLSGKNETIDLDEVESLAKKNRPALILAGASAYPRQIDFKGFASVAEKYNALFMVDMAHIAGLVAAGVHPSPVPWADVVTSTTHKTLRGPRGGLILSKAKHAAKIRSQVFPGIQGGPMMHIIAAKAVAFKEALEPSFKEYQKQVVANASALADELQKREVRLVSGGTDNHLMLADLTGKGISGKDAEEMLGTAGITVNKNSVPNDPLGPVVTSGIRIGTPLLTSRGMKTSEMKEVAACICDVLDKSCDINSVAGRVKDLCRQFPLYGTGR
ncbi:serine hydroxymethyltransferase [Desulfamplus magnetovallimortis]|uniref:Serine hydroxymethyltransferase n=1 Tax=Desulfamplus magnetovallimortis TaxID=1246637 RepID=A0A1W1HA66_9BACT|nr:serine hydroxymethyltransferase [Desulfamplus magnetovallimortis]SLM29295.1 serine hydroxymethyltransferase [Desulfamplus magnetovallimortis]